MPFYRLRDGPSFVGPAYKRQRGVYQKPTFKRELTQLKRKVARFKPEVKQSVIASSIANVPVATGGITYISGVAQGVDDINRLGNKIRPTMLEVVVSMTSTNGELTNAFNSNYGVYIVKDTMSAGAVPAISGTSNAIFQTFSPRFALQTPESRNRFKVLRQWDMTAPELITGNVISLRKWRIPLTGTTDYIDTTSAVTGAQHNAYYMVVLSTDAAETVDFSINGFFHFTDL